MFTKKLLPLAFFTTLLVSAAEASPRVSYQCSFDKALDTTQLICSIQEPAGSPVINFAETLRSSSQSGRAIYRFAQTTTLPLISCTSATIGGTVDTIRGRFSVTTQDKHLVLLRANKRFIQISRPNAHTSPALLFTNRGSLLYSGCDSCSVRVSGSCTKRR